MLPYDHRSVVKIRASRQTFWVARVFPIAQRGRLASWAAANMLLSAKYGGRPPFESYIFVREYCALYNVS